VNGTEIFIPSGTTIGIDTDFEIPDGIKVVVLSGGGFTVDDAAASVLDAELLTIKGTLEIAAGGTFAVAGDAPIEVPNTGTLIIASSLYSTPNGFVNNGTLTLATSNGLDFASASKNIINNGILNVSGTGTAVTLTGGTFTNPADKEINVTDGGTITIITAPLTNAGTINVDGGSFTNGTGPLNNSGTINVADGIGNVDFAGGLTNSGTLSVAGDSTPATGTISIAGPLANTGTIAINKTVSDITDITNSGNLTVGADGTVVITGAFVNTAATSKNVIVSGALTAPGGTFNNTDSKVTVAGGTLTFGTAPVTAAQVGTIEVKEVGQLVEVSTTIVGTGGFELGANGVFTYAYISSAAVYTVAGAVTLNSAFSMPTSTELKVLASGILTIGASGALTVANSTPGVTGALNAQLNILSTGSIILGSVGSIFYPVGSSTPTPINTPIGVNNFKWVAAPSGTAPPDFGWKAQ
jgi:hypothetical protein